MTPLPRPPYASLPPSQPPSSGPGCSPRIQVPTLRAGLLVCCRPLATGELQPISACRPRPSIDRGSSLVGSGALPVRMCIMISVIATERRRMWKRRKDLLWFGSRAMSNHEPAVCRNVSPSPRQVRSKIGEGGVSAHSDAAVTTAQESKRHIHRIKKAPRRILQTQPHHGLLAALIYLAPAMRV